MKVLFVLNPKIPYSQSHRLGDFSFTRMLLKSLKILDSLTTYTVMNVEGVSPEQISLFEEEYGTHVVGLPEGYVSNSSRLYHKPYFTFLKEFCETEKIDVVHFNQAQSSVASHIKEFHQSTGIPSLFTFHTPPELKSIYVGVDNFKYLATNDTTRLVAVSETMKSRWLKVFGGTEEDFKSLATVCNGVEIGDLEVSKERRIYACAVVGRVDPLKNSLAMVKLLRELWARTGRRSVFIGDTFNANYSQNDTYISDTMRELSEGVEEGSIEWVKSIPHSEVYDYLSRSSFYLNLSEVETFSLTTCEAMSVGTPAIGFNKNGVGELIQYSEAGLLVQKVPRKPYKYYFDSIVDYIYNTEVSVEERVALAERVREKYSSLRMAKEYLDLYTKIAGGVNVHA